MGSFSENLITSRNGAPSLMEVPESTLPELQEIVIPVGFKLGISFSPLHTDGDHPIENEEACAWQSVGSDKPVNRRCQKKFFLQLDL